MGSSILINLTCLILSLIIHSNLRFGVRANSAKWDKWKATMMVKIAKLAQEPFIDDHSLLDDMRVLTNLTTQVNEIPIHAMPIFDQKKVGNRMSTLGIRAMDCFKQKALQKLGTRLITPIMRIMEYCNQLINKKDNLDRQTHPQYLENLKQRIGSIILTLNSEFHTFVIEVEPEQFATDGWTIQNLEILIQKIGESIDKNEIFCAQPRFEQAKKMFNELKFKNFELGKCKEIGAHLKLSILEGEMLAKILAYSNNPIDGDGFMEFSGAFLAESKALLGNAENLSYNAKENLRENLKELVQKARQKSQPLREGIAQKLDNLMSLVEKEIAKLQNKQEKVRLIELRQICATLLDQIQIVGIMPNLDIVKNVNKKLTADGKSHANQLYDFDQIFELINEQKGTILKSFSLSFDEVIFVETGWDGTGRDGTDPYRIFVPKSKKEIVFKTPKINGGIMPKKAMGLKPNEIYQPTITWVKTKEKYR